MGKLNQFLVSLMLVLVAGSASAEEGLFLISDVDDTLKRTHSVSRSDAIDNLFKNKIEFAGLSELYVRWACGDHQEALLKNDCVAARGFGSSMDRLMTYVTAAPPEILFSQRNFLKGSFYPSAPLIARPSVFHSTLKYKKKTIRDLVIKHPGRSIILIGDNGEKDPPAYHAAVLAIAEIEERSVLTMIHQLYDQPIGVALEDSQLGYLTAADLALQFWYQGWINEEDLRDVSAIVHERLSSWDQEIQETVLPGWVSCQTFWQSYERPERAFENEETEILISEIEAMIEVRCTL